MANGFMVVSDKNWERATPEERDWMIYNTLQSVNSRLKSLEERKLFDRTCSFLGGIIGGVAAMFGMRLIK